MGPATTRLTYEFGEFHVDATQRLLRARTDGEPLPLTSKAFETLLYLIEHRGELVDKAALMQAVWPNVVVEENNLNQCISAVRRALGESATEHRFIVTVPGRGYRFVAPVKTLMASAEQSVSAEARSAPAAPPPREEVARTSPAPEPISRRLSPQRLVILAALAVLAAGVIWYVLRSSHERSLSEATTSGAATPATTVAKLRLAILPLENLSPDPDNAFFADGLHEEILATLARQAPGLEVISRTTMMGYRAKPKPVQVVAKELAASHVLEGSVRREQSKVRLTLQLIDARSDRHLWSHNYDRTLKDALTLQSEVANEVASQLSVQLVGGQPIEAATPKNAEAYDLYLKGLLARQFVGPLAPVERFRDVEDLFSRAIELDPVFAPAYAQRATFRGAMFAFNYDVSDAQLRRIREDVNAGLQLAPEDPLVLAAEALYWSWVERDLPRALATFESAEAAHLADPMFIAGRSILLLRMRRTDETLRLNERLLALDPGNPFILGSTIATLGLAHKPAEALQMTQRAQEQFPGASPLEFVRAAIVFGYTGRTEELRTAVENASRSVPPLTLLDSTFGLLSIEGRYSDLRAFLDGISAPTARVIAGTGASSLFGVGDRPTAYYRGWSALFLGDNSGAAKQGRAVLDFVASRRETQYNAWFLKVLKAQGHMFLAQHEAAIAAGREALELMPPTRDALSWIATAASVASVYAWSGAQDQAVTLLEELATATPGPGPAQITRSPFVNIPLKNNARYRALVERLEAQMRAMKL